MALSLGAGSSLVLGGRATAKQAALGRNGSPAPALQAGALWAGAAPSWNGRRWDGTGAQHRRFQAGAAHARAVQYCGIKLHEF